MATVIEGGSFIKEAKKVRLNEEIRVPQVRLIDAKGNQVGVVSHQDALTQAIEVGLDLVEIAPNVSPPVCKIMDYGKYIFQQNKKTALAKKHQKKIQLKRLRIRATIEEGDYQVKLRSLIRFLEEGHKIEISLRFRGREMEHKELGLGLLQRLKQDTADYAAVEREPQFEGRQMLMVLMSKKTK